MLQYTGRLRGVSLRRLEKTWTCSQRRREMANDANTIRAGDRVILQMKGKHAFMTQKLNTEKSTIFQAGEVKHSEIIGKRSRDTIKSSRGYEIRAFLPTLAEYIVLVPRIVTPVYPADANLLVSLLDINVDTYRPSSEEPPMEILEGGTGHGSLTLHLARAIHSANPAPDDDLSLPIPIATEGAPIEPMMKKRQAVIHTIDISERHSQHAQQTVSGFRQGMYYRDIDFHFGDVSEWIEHQFLSRGLDAKKLKDKAFLSHVALDMADAHQHLEKAASALHVDGGLLVFNPSITQIVAAVKTVKEKYLPLRLDRVLELGASMTGGKEWDVRCVRPRAKIQAEDAAGKAKAVAIEAQLGIEPASDGLNESADNNTNNRDPDNVEILDRPDEGEAMVCRPKVGYIVTGGGFVAHFKKMKR